MQLLHNEGDAKNFQSSEQKLSIDISHPHFPLEREISISIFTYF